MWHSFIYSFIFQLADKELTFGFYETSARNGRNVFDAFRKLATVVTEICNPDVVIEYKFCLSKESVVNIDLIEP